MADEADRAQADLEIYEAVINNKRFELVPGKAGDCDLCGEYFARLVNGHCARCRDKHGLD